MSSPTTSPLTIQQMRQENRGEDGFRAKGMFAFMCFADDNRFYFDWSTAL